MHIQTDTALRPKHAKTQNIHEQVHAYKNCARIKRSLHTCTYEQISAHKICMHKQPQAPVYMCMYSYTSTTMSKNIHERIDLHTYTYMHAYVRAKHTQTFTSTYIQTHPHTHEYLCQTPHVVACKYVAECVHLTDNAESKGVHFTYA